MTQTLTTRFTAIVLAAAIVAVSWLPTVSVPVSAKSGAAVSAVA